MTYENDILYTFVYNVYAFICTLSEFYLYYMFDKQDMIEKKTFH